MKYVAIVCILTAVTYSSPYITIVLEAANLYKDYIESQELKSISKKLDKQMLAEIDAAIESLKIAKRFPSKKHIYLSSVIYAATKAKSYFSLDSGTYVPSYNKQTFTGKAARWVIKATWGWALDSITEINKVRGICRNRNLSVTEIYVYVMSNYIIYCAKKELGLKYHFEKKEAVKKMLIDNFMRGYFFAYCSDSQEKKITKKIKKLFWEDSSIQSWIDYHKKRSTSCKSIFDEGIVMSEMHKVNEKTTLFAIDSLKMIDQMD